MTRLFGFAIFLMAIFPLHAEVDEPRGRILCYDRFEDEIWEMAGKPDDDGGCKAMLIAGTLGICFEGQSSSVVKKMNRGDFVYSRTEKVLPGSAELIGPHVIRYASYEGYVGWTRQNNELFRCPQFEAIKPILTEAAQRLESTVDYAVSRRYREEFGEPFWFSDSEM